MKDGDLNYLLYRHPEWRFHIVLPSRLSRYTRNFEDDCAGSLTHSPYHVKPREVLGDGIIQDDDKT